MRRTKTRFCKNHRINDSEITRNREHTGTNFWNKQPNWCSVPTQGKEIDFPKYSDITKYKVVQIWPGQTVSCLHTISPGHIWTTVYMDWATDDNPRRNRWTSEAGTGENWPNSSSAWLWLEDDWMTKQAVPLRLLSSGQWTDDLTVQLQLLARRGRGMLQFLHKSLRHNS
jgi:hypothetical protein